MEAGAHALQDGTVGCERGERQRKCKGEERRLARAHTRKTQLQHHGTLGRCGEGHWGHGRGRTHTHKLERLFDGPAALQALL